MVLFVQIKKIMSNITTNEPSNYVAHITYKQCSQTPPPPPESQLLNALRLRVDIAS